jgi:carbon storage regulator
MLVLGRRTNESITIGQNIVVTVVEIRRNYVRLTIDAPREVPVHRQEVFRRVEQASRPAPPEAGQLDLAEMPVTTGKPAVKPVMAC